MTEGVIYFNQGTKCILRIAVSLHSLRKHYDGPVAIISSGQESHNILKQLAIDDDTQIIEADYSNRPKINDDKKNNVLLKKAAINDHTPFDISVFLDADTLVRGDVSELFELAKQHDFVVPRFTNWSTAKRGIVRRIEGWKHIYPKLMKSALEFGPAINCGVFAFKKNTEFVQKWSDLVEPGRDNFIPDETGMQVVIHQFRHFVCDQKFNVSCKYSDPYHKDTRVIHYHGRKHCRLNDSSLIIYGGDLWVQEYEEVIKDDYLEINKIAGLNDRMLKKYLSRGPAKIDDKRITIVTAVNPPYVEKLKLTLPTWQRKPQLKDCPLIVFYNGFSDAEKELAFVRECGREVKFIPWEMPGAESNRELMLSAFVLGAPKAVETPYWLKIDADAYFSDAQDIILEHFYNYDISAHKWKYSKPGSWLCDLDDWAEANDIDGDIYLNDEQRKEAMASKRYGHRRIASFICLHKTEFTREAAEYISNRLPIPSHDTYLWYMCERLPDRKWCWHNMKKLGCHNQTNIHKLRENIIQCTKGL